MTANHAVTIELVTNRVADHHFHYLRIEIKDFKNNLGTEF